MFSQLTAFLCSLTKIQQALLAGFVLIKLLLIVYLPLTGDEAYFIGWGQNLSWGYYDHPPAVGWILAAMSQITDHLYWYRAFAVFGALLISVLIYQMVIMQNSKRTELAFWTALVFFVSPVSFLFVVTANDTVLVVFAMLGVFFFSRAYLYQKWSDALFAGLFLGLAFLSKYFAAFMLFGLLLFSVWQWKKFNPRQLALMIAFVLLAIVENWLFNASHCWNNILFNFFSRTQQSQFDISNVIGYLLILAVLFSPLGIWYGYKAFKATSSEAGTQPTGNNLTALVWFAGAPLLLVLLIVSFKNSVGLHWPLIAVSLLYVLYAKLKQEQLRKLFVFNAWFSLIAGIAILLALHWAEDLVSASQKHQVALYKTPQKVCAALPVQNNQMFFTLGYSSQSALAYHCQNDNVHVFASTSKYGREDDKLIDFKALDGKDLSILLTHKKDIAKVKPYFDAVQITPLTLSDSSEYYWLSGQKFNYALYREKIILPVNQQFYTASNWLKKLSPFDSSCAFKQRYDLP